MSRIIAIAGSLFLLGCVMAALPQLSRQEAAAMIPRDQRPHGPNAPWNVPVAEIRRLPDGDRLVDMLWNGASERPGNFNINMGEAFAVYYAEDATERLPVRMKWRNRFDGEMVPWNPQWRIPPGSDRKVVILDRANGREWNLFQAVYEDGRLKATNGSLVPGRYDTYEGVNPPSRGIGIQYSAMLVRPFEIRQGVIEHALAMTINNTDGTTFVAPAAKLEHPGRPAGIPEGARFALHVTDAEIEAWIAKLPDEVRDSMADPARVIARALRDYGWFITDTGGAGSFEFEARVSAQPTWEELGLAEVRAKGKLYPRDLLDGLLTRENIRAVVPSDQYPVQRLVQGE